MENVIEEVKTLTRENDVFGTYDKAFAIKEFLELDENKQLLSKNNLIALYGEWGIGKSCLMKTIYEEIDKDKFEVTWFDTWKYEKDENLAFSLFKFIGKETFLEGLLKENKKILTNAYNLFKSLVSGFEVNLLGAVTFNGRDTIDKAEEYDKEGKTKVENEKCLWERVNEFEEEFKTLNVCKDKSKRLIVFLDDLDRCESENIVKLISAIKLFLSVNPNVIFIMGIDREAVTLALQNKYNNDFNKADQYLEKIFPINFDLTTNANSENFVNYVGEITGLSEQDSNYILDFLNQINFTNPRQIKKVFRKYSIIKNYIKSKGMDIDNRIMVALIFYLIILNYFYHDSYKSLLLKTRLLVYKDITFYTKSPTSGKCEFLEYNKKCWFKRSEEIQFEIFQFLLRFSPHKFSRNEMEYRSIKDGSILINHAKWIYFFDNCIETDFIKFVIRDIENIRFFMVQGNNYYDEERIYNYIKEISKVL